MEAELAGNIYTFVNILSAASTEIVKDWDLSSVTSAFKWAYYCMEIERETRNHCSLDHLNRQIQLMTMMSNPVTLRILTTKNLGEADQLLCKTLLRNPHVPSKLLKRMIETTSFQTEQMEYIFKTETESADGIYLLLGEDVAFTKKNDKIQAFQIMERLVTLYELCCCRKRFQCYLNKVVKELETFCNGWNVMLNIFLIDVSLEDHSLVTCIKETLLNTINKRSEDLNCGLWTCTSSLLLDVSSIDDRFGDMYTDFLMLWAQKMVPRYGIDDSGDFYHWRDDVARKCDRYKDLKEHIFRIFGSHTPLRRKMETKLEEKSKLNYLNIYKDLVKAYKDANSGHEWC